MRAQGKGPASYIRANNLPLAIGLMLLAWFIFSIMDTSAKWLATQGLSPWQTTFCRFFFNFLAISIFLIPREISRDGIGVLKSNRPVLQFVRGLALAVGSLLNFTAVLYLPLTLTTAIFFVSPLVVCLLAVPILNERVGIRRLTAIGVGFLGVLVIVQPFGQGFSWPMLISIASMICASLYFTLSRAVATSDPASVSQLYASLPGTLLLAPFAMVFWANPTTTIDWIVLIGIGLWGAVGHLILTIAHRYAPASTLAPIIYVQVIYMTAWSWLIFAQVPGPWTIIGTLIIVASGLYLWMRERHLVKQAGSRTGGSPDRQEPVK